MKATNLQQKGATMPHDTSTYRDKLAHILWIGGPPDSGKTTLAALLAERHGLQVYHFDRHEMDHIRRAHSTRHPHLSALHTRLTTLDERALAHELWLSHPPSAMAQRTIGSWSERVALAIEDLLAMPTTPPIIAEGPGFFPERLLPFLTDSRQAVWLLPTESFKRASAIRRDKPGSRHLTTNPQQAQENLILRDLLMGNHIRHGIAKSALTMHEVDGTRTLEETATLIEAHFAPRLR
jgi:DNA polymerase III delta prime subunit